MLSKLALAAVGLPATAALVSPKARIFLCKFWFALMFFKFTTLLWLASRLMYLVPFGSVKTKQRWTCILAKYCFGGAIAMCPFVKVENMDHLDWDKAIGSDPNKGVFMCLNHASLLDGLLISALFPHKFIARTRTLLKAGLLKLPLFGYVCVAAGHFPVYFSSSKVGAFSVDKEKQARVMKGVQEHIGDGGHLGLFPEGQVNKNPRTLQLFRRGAFVTAMKNDMRVWGFAITGAGECWPKQEAIGGNPVTIRCSLFPIMDADSGDAEAVAMAKDVTDPNVLCEKAQVRFQAELDALYAKGHPRGPAFDEKKSN